MTTKIDFFNAEYPGEISIDMQTSLHPYQMEWMEQFLATCRHSSYEDLVRTAIEYALLRWEDGGQMFIHYGTPEGEVNIGLQVTLPACVAWLFERYQTKYGISESDLLYRVIENYLYPLDEAESYCGEEELEDVDEPIIEN